MSRTILIDDEGEGDRTPFSDLDLRLNAMTAFWGAHQGGGGTSLSERLKETMGVIVYMLTLATGENKRTVKEASHRVEKKRGDSPK